MARQVLRWGSLLAVLAMAGCAPPADDGVVSDAPGLYTRPVKRWILMIADGCGYGQREAHALYRYGWRNTAVWDSFPVQLAMQTHSSEGRAYDPQKAWADREWVLEGYTDSAAAATAMSTGHKTYNKAVGVDLERQPLDHVMAAAEAKGMATGVVSTVPWSHATPAGFIVHQPDRNEYAAIANEMIASNVDVIMGGGHPDFDHDGQPRSDQEYKFVGGEATWQTVLAGQAGGDADGDGQPDPFTPVSSRAEFQALQSGTPPERVLGTFEAAETTQMRRRGYDRDQPYAAPRLTNVPTLTEMSLGALHVLSQDPDGFYLMIEGGAVDWACHDNRGGRAIEEMVDFEDAVKAVVAWVEQNGGWDETLLIVTGDHETGSLTGPNAAGLWASMGYSRAGEMPSIAWHTGGHSNALIPLSAIGCGSDLLVSAATMKDPRRGAYLDNTEVAKTGFALLPQS